MKPITIKVTTENYNKMIIVTEQDIKVFNTKEDKNGNTSKL